MRKTTHPPTKVLHGDDDYLRECLDLYLSFLGLLKDTKAHGCEFHIYMSKDTLRSLRKGTSKYFRCDESGHTFFDVGYEIDEMRVGLYFKPVLQMKESEE